MAKMTKNDLRYFEIAHREAQKSTYNPFHLGCVLVYKGHVIGRGNNSSKSAPIQERYNRFREFRYGPQLVEHKLHAEIASLKSVPYQVDKETDWSKVSCYIYRISKGRESGFGTARPCGACMQALIDKGVKKVYYTTNHGYAYEEIL